MKTVAKCFLAVLLVLVSAVVSKADPVRVFVDQAEENCVRHGAVVLVEKLSEIGIESEIVKVPEGASIVIGSFKVLAASGFSAGDDLPDSLESYSVWRKDGVLMGSGIDSVGAMYAAYDIAEQAQMGGSLDSVKPRAKSPSMEIRAVNPFFHVQAFENQDSWYYDDEFWETYLDELSLDRYNLLDIHAMYGLITTFFPNCYLYLVKSDSYPDVGVSEEQAEKNLARFNKIITMAKDRGLRVSLMSYHASWRMNHDDDSFEEPTDEDLMKYTREVVKEIIEKCPDLWMIGFRIGESGRREDFFEHSYIAGIKESGRDIMLFTRTWLAAPWQVMQIANAYPNRTFLEIKYNGEQLGLPYHAMPQNRRGQAPSYTYENYTDWPRSYKIIWQIRSNGTHRLFRWGNTEFARRTMKSVQFADAAGFTMEPMSSYYPMKNYFLKEEDGFDFFTWDHQRNWFWYMLWGRLAYDNSVDEEVLKLRFAQHYGQDASSDVYELVNNMSMLVPIIYSWRCMGPDHRHMAPEYETGGTMTEFAKNLPLDPQSIHSIKDYVNRYLYKDPMLGAMLEPEEAADMLDKYADLAIAAAERAKKVVEPENTEFESLLVELETVVPLARYYSNKIRASLHFEFFNEKNSYPELKLAEKYMDDARSEWEELASIGDKYYVPILDTLRMRRFVNSPKFLWSDLTSQLDADEALIEKAKASFEKNQKKEDLRIAHIPRFIGNSGEAYTVQATVVGVVSDIAAKLFYRPAGGSEDDFVSVKMVKQEGPVFEGVVPASDAEGEIEYYIMVVGGDQKARYPSKESARRFVPETYSAEEYADGSAKLDKMRKEKRAEYEKQRYVTVTFATESDPPKVSVKKVEKSADGSSVEIVAMVNDESEIQGVELFYKNTPSSELWQSTMMEDAGNGLFSKTLDLTPSGLLYYFHAADVNYNAAAYPDFLEETPYLVIESWDPAAPVEK